MKSSEFHRLAAILFSDIVGYTSTTQANEQEAARQIRVHRRIIEENCAEYNGEILQYYGDGSLVIFQSALDAVRCALDIQKSLEPEIVPLRIGIHLGEIFFEEDQFIGDGINVASRVQSEAGTGEVYISGAVADVVRNKPRIYLNYVGEKSLKNVADPVKLYSVVRTQSEIVAQDATAPTGKIPRKLLALIAVLIAVGALSAAIFYGTRREGTYVSASARGQIETIAVLPFTGPGGDTEQEFFIEGISDEIRSKLAIVEGLDVRSRASSAQVKEQNLSSPAIADILDVDYILEGRIQPVPTGLRVSLSVIDARRDQLLRPLGYSCSEEELFGLLDDIAESVVSAVGIELSNPATESDGEDSRPVNYEAQKYYLLGRSAILKASSADAIKQSEDYFRRSIAADPQYGRAYAGLAEVLMFMAQWGYAPIRPSLTPAREAAVKALEFSPEAAETQHALGMIYEFERQFDKAEEVLAKAISLDPSYAMTYARLARIRSMQGKHNEAIDLFRQLGQQDPLEATWRSGLSELYVRAQRIDEAIEHCKIIIEEYPGNNRALWGLGEAYTCNGRYDEAIDALLLRDIPTADKNWMLACAYGFKGETRKAAVILEYLIQKFESSYVPPAMIAAIYYSTGNLDETREWLELEEDYYKLTFPVMRPLQDNPDFAGIYDVSNWIPSDQKLK